ncbi:MAG TPA: gliding motility protein RemB, partial [Bacteroidia bacterium]|nr:gliding motility protein RemB [Bacteroidia bacterium]
FQAEYNQVSPYCYSHAKPSQSYSHYNQALAHPLGANFKEIIGILNYNKGRFFIKGKINYATMRKDSSGINFGNNIFKSDLIALSISQNNGLKTTLNMIDTSIGYVINPATNLSIIAGLSNRFYSNNKEFSETQFFYIGISTSLTNVYYDF